MDYQKQSETISGPFEAIRDHQRPSETISGPSKAYRGAAPHERLDGRKVALLASVQHGPVLLALAGTAPDGLQATYTHVLGPGHAILVGTRPVHDHVRELHRDELDVSAQVE